MDRRSMFGMLGGLGMFGGDQRPPNFLFIFFDKCRRDAIGAYGRTDVHTPNMDQLATGGVRFDNCYAPQPLCGPCRASILTGKYPH